MLSSLKQFVIPGYACSKENSKCYVILPRWLLGTAGLEAYKCYTIQNRQTQHPCTVLEELVIITEGSDIGNSITLIQDT